MKFEISDGKNLVKFGGRTFLPARKAGEISGQISEQISQKISETSFQISRLFSETSFSCVRECVCVCEGEYERERERVFVRVYVYVSVFLSLSLSLSVCVCVCICVSVCLCFCVSMCLCVRVSVCPCVSHRVLRWRTASSRHHLFCVSVCLCVCVFVCLCVSMHVCLINKNCNDAFVTSLGCSYFEFMPNILPTRPCKLSIKCLSKVMPPTQLHKTLRVCVCGGAQGQVNISLIVSDPSRVQTQGRYSSPCFFAFLGLRHQNRSDFEIANLRARNRHETLNSL